LTGAAAVAWVNGRVYTGHRWVEALLVEGDRVVAASTSSEVRRGRPTGTTTVDLAGRWVLPGLIDAHLHLARSVLAPLGVDLNGVTSVRALVARVRRRLEGGRHEPLLGWGWDQERFSERRWPSRDDLDKLPTDRPIVLHRHCLHAAVVNSAALEMVGLDDASADPPRGRLGRSDGRLDGLLFEDALARLRPLEAKAFDLAVPGVRRFFDRAASVGLTTIAPMTADPREIRAAVGAYDREPLPVRLRWYVRADRLSALSSRISARERDDVRLSGVKIVADGSLGARTAWLEEPYSDAPDESGLPLGTAQEMTASVRSATARRLPVAVHAIGDRALRRVVEVLEAERTIGTPRIEHASVTPPILVDALAHLGASIVVQPHFLPSDAWLPKRLGDGRARWTYAFRTLRDRGLTVAGSSDAPVEPIDPWTGVNAAVAPRPTYSKGEELLPQEAVEMYTSAAGRALGEPWLGTLEPGAWADLVVLGVHGWETLLERGAAAIQETYRGGALTYRADATGRSVGVDPTKPI
jgi:predicted amidohydrolase YtcJ